MVLNNLHNIENSLKITKPIDITRHLATLCHHAMYFKYTINITIRLSLYINYACVGAYYNFVHYSILVRSIYKNIDLCFVHVLGFEKPLSILGFSSEFIELRFEFSFDYYNLAACQYAPFKVF